MFEEGQGSGKWRANENRSGERKGERRTKGSGFLWVLCMWCLLYVSFFFSGYGQSVSTEGGEGVSGARFAGLSSSGDYIFDILHTHGWDSASYALSSAMGSEGGGSLREVKAVLRAMDGRSFVSARHVRILCRALGAAAQEDMGLPFLRFLPQLLKSEGSSSSYIEILRRCERFFLQKTLHTTPSMRWHVRLGSPRSYAFSYSAPSQASLALSAVLEEEKRLAQQSQGGGGVPLPFSEEKEGGISGNSPSEGLDDGFSSSQADGDGWGEEDWGGSDWGEDFSPSWADYGEAESEDVQQWGSVKTPFTQQATPVNIDALYQQLAVPVPPSLPEFKGGAILSFHGAKLYFTQGSDTVMFENVVGDFSLLWSELKVNKTQFGWFMPFSGSDGLRVEAQDMQIDMSSGRLHSARATLSGGGLFRILLRVIFFLVCGVRDKARYFGLVLFPRGIILLCRCLIRVFVIMAVFLWKGRRLWVVLCLPEKAYLRFNRPLRFVWRFKAMLFASIVRVFRVLRHRYFSDMGQIR